MTAGRHLTVVVVDWDRVVELVPVALEEEAEKKKKLLQGEG